MKERFEYVSVNELQKDKMEFVRSSLIAAAKSIENNCPKSRGSSLAITKLEEALYWANKSICGNDF